MSARDAAAIVCLMFAGAMATGCASLSFDVRVEPVVFQDTRPIVEKARQLGAAEADAVQVLVGALPPGVSRTPGSSGLKVDPVRYEVLGTVRATPRSAWYTPFNWWTYDYVEGEEWRKPYCAVQVPLGWVTIGIWGIVPLSYPCAVRETDSDDAVAARRVRIVDQLKRGTKALGGNLVIIEDFGSETLHGVSWWAHALPSAYGQGFALRVKAATDSPADVPATHVEGRDRRVFPPVSGILLARIPKRSAFPVGM